MVHAYYLQAVTAWAKSNVDAIFLMDDLGSNRSLLISPAMWREIFKPLHKEYCDIAHAAGKFVFYHTDGNILSICDELVGIGIDALNSQLFCMDIEQLGRKLKGKVTFWGEIDQQHLLPFGTTDDIEGAVRRVRRALADPKGGVIANCTWRRDYPRRNVETVFRAWQ
jgi:uroporphyrinogen decarboxylase